MHMNLNCSLIPITELSGPVKSKAFIPKTLLKNDMGRNIMLITVKVMIERPWFIVSTDRLMRPLLQ